MDLEARRKLGGLIDKATGTGQLSLDSQQLRQIKAIARKSDENVTSAYHFLAQKLKADSSAVRYLALLLVNEFFTRSARFRTLLTDGFQNFLELVIGTKVYKPLPAPSERAVLLRQKGLEFIESWHEQFGASNKQLRMGYHYLKNSLKMRFPEVRLQSEIAERERKQREEQTQKILRVKFEKVKQEIDEYQAELNPLFQEMEGCFDILMPREFDDARISSNTTTRDEKGKERMNAEEDEEEEIEWDSTHDTAEGKAEDDLDWDAFEEDDADQDVDDVLRRHGIGSSGYELNITFDKSFADLTRDEADEEDSHASASEGTKSGEKRPDSGKQAIIECLRNDLRLLKRRYVPLIDDWYDVLLRVEFTSAAQSDEETTNAAREKRREKDRLLRQVIDLKSSVATAVRRCSDLGIVFEETSKAASSSGLVAATSTSSSIEEQARSTSDSCSARKRKLVELFGEDSEEEDSDQQEKKSKALEEAPSAESAAGEVTGSEGGDDDEEEEELEFEEEISIIEPATDESYAVDDEEACDVGSLMRPGEESFITGSPSSSPSSSLSPSFRSPSSTGTAPPSSVPASPYAPPSSSSSSSARMNEKKQKKEEDVKVRERLRKKLGITAKRKPPVVKPRKLSTHRPLVL